jgi:hypothetical protein
MCVELGTINACEFRLAVDGYPTPPTHSCAIHHQRIEARHGRNLLLARSIGDSLHHWDRAGGEDVVHDAPSHQRGKGICYESMKSLRPVVRCDDNFVGHRPHLVEKDQMFGITRTHDGNDAISGHGKSFGHGKYDRRTDPTSDHNASTEVTDFGRSAERSEDVSQMVADVLGVDLYGGGANSLHHKCDGAIRWV